MIPANGVLTLFLLLAALVAVWLGWRHRRIRCLAGALAIGVVGIPLYVTAVAGYVVASLAVTAVLWIASPLRRAATRDPAGSGQDIFTRPA
ncbi:hypothetical protein BK004_01675 [bacterium CG10_46_32]|nr:MAG: hypothetical protein BK004_01675 [bacterium CG10_46_32]PIR56294.1 MAG: hypothetical protein COU73_01700 [Parcubacteria group bacterium CG10_big_fil_rev_8_21_14_0_10_46_32]